MMPNLLIWARMSVIVVDLPRIQQQTASARFSLLLISLLGFQISLNCFVQELQEELARFDPVIPDGVLTYCDVLDLQKLRLLIQNDGLPLLALLGVVYERLVEICPVIVVCQIYKIGQPTKEPYNCVHPALVLSSDQHD